MAAVGSLFVACGPGAGQDPITGGLPAWVHEGQGARSQAIEPGGRRADLPPGAKIFFFEDLKDGKAVAHGMAAHNPYHGATFSPDIYHLESKAYIQPTSGKSGILNSMGKDAVWIRFAKPVQFLGAYVGEPHGRDTDVWFEGYLGARLVGTSPRLTANRTFRPPRWLAAGFASKVDRVVVRRAAWGCKSGCTEARWWVMDDIAFMEGTAVKRVDLLALRADREPGGVRVSWLTGSETRCAAFELLTCEGPACDAGAFAPRPGLGRVPCADDPSGAAYSVVDARARRDARTGYVLREHESAGAVNEYGPVVLEAGSMSASWAPPASPRDGNRAFDSGATAGCAAAPVGHGPAPAMLVLLGLAVAASLRDRRR